MNTDTGAQPDTELEEIRATITAFAPTRLDELDREKDQAVALALACNNLGPVQDFLRHWRTVGELARDLIMTARLRAEFPTARDSMEGRTAALEIAALLLAAAEADH